MKILQLVSGTDVNGALVHCRLLARQLALRGHDVTIACRRRSWLWNQTEDSSIRLVTCEMKRWPLVNIRRFAEWIRREKFDVMHTHMSSAHLFGIIMKRLTGVPVVATAHSRHIQPHWHWNDHVIANSESTRRYHLRYNLLNSRKIETVHCFIDTDRFRLPEPVIHRAIRRQWRFKPDTRVMMIAGDVVPYKGHWHLFQSLPELTRRYPDLRLVIVGRFNRNENFVRKLRKFQMQNDLFQRVKWIGRRDNMQQMLAAADVVVIPSTVESLGMIALESMAVGTPVVASKTGGLTELIDHESNGLLVPPRSPEAITGAVSRILDEDEFRNGLVHAGQRRVATQFAPEVLTKRIEKVLARVASGHRKRATEEQGSGREARKVA